MPTISLCMIVKNEEAVLARCLDSVADLMDEIIIVDTGSTDKTKEIAAKYTDKIYDFEWVNDFSAARNYSFSKATMDYIYAPDADELLDAINHERFRILKQCLDDEVDIVQMKYLTENPDDPVMNVKKEYRPKLFKRLRKFVWIDPVHETVRLDPVVFDSDVEIIHRPQNSHAKRDFSIFVRELDKRGVLSAKLRTMYARELLKMGSVDDLEAARDYFNGLWEENPINDAGKEAACILCRYYRLIENTTKLMKYALRDMLETPCSEICYELGMHFYDSGDYGEAIVWFTNAAYETAPILDVHTGGDKALRGLIDSYGAIIEEVKVNPSGTYKDNKPILDKQLEIYRDKLRQCKEDLDNWQVPEEL
ncbi:MAG: glycosyltransferase family 2 protein [Wujia sp.]